MVVGLAVYAAFFGRLPPAFAIITTIELGVLILVWRSLALIAVAVGADRRAAGRARGASDDDRRQRSSRGPDDPQAAGSRGVIDLDESLERASRTDVAHWGEDRAGELARGLADALALRVDFEPTDEEWARLLGGGACHGMISVRVPIALVTRFVAPTLAGIAPDVVAVLIDGFMTESLCGSPELLRATVLPDGWDVDFDPEAFSANDLFVESV